MLIEIWERLRGYHNWTEARAVIESAVVTKEPVGERGILFITTAADAMSWYDQSGQKHSAHFTVPDKSPLLELKAGDGVTIRYDPARPDHFYLRDLLRSKVHDFFIKVVAGVCLGLIVIGYILYAYARHFTRTHGQKLW